MREAQAGFTLIEILVGLTLLGLLFVGIFGGLSTSSQALRRTEAHVERLDAVAAAQQTLRSELSSAYPQFVVSAPDRQRIDFSGSADRMQFLAPLPLRYGVADVVRWDLAVAENALHLTWRLDRDPPRGFPAESPTDTILLQDVSSLNISYFGPDNQGGPSSWREEWRERKSMPELIRIRVEPAALEWPEFFVAPLRQVSADCVFDPADPLGCRRQ